MERERLESLFLPMSCHLEDLHDLQLIHGVCGSVCIHDILHQMLELLTVLGQHLGKGEIGQDHTLNTVVL